MLETVEKASTYLLVNVEDDDAAKVKTDKTEKSRLETLSPAVKVTEKGLMP